MHGTTREMPLSKKGGVVGKLPWEVDKLRTKTPQGFG